METQTQNTNQNVYDNQGFSSLSALQIRLDTKPVLEDIETFMRGCKIVVVEEQGKITTKRIPYGKPKANQLGIQSIMAMLTSIFNNQTVQGNFTIGQYEGYIREVHIDLVSNIVNNCYNWGIEDDDIDVIIDMVMANLQLFISRPIGNKERDSYERTIRTTESNVLQAKQGGFLNFGGVPNRA